MIQQTTFYLSAKRRGCHLVTREVLEHLPKPLPQTGLLHLFVQHTSCALSINENADPDVKTDFLRRLDEVYPWEHVHDRHMEGNTAAHLKTSTVGHSQTIVIDRGRLVLGTWQGIYFCEFDGPRQRTYHVKVLKD